MKNAISFLTVILFTVFAQANPLDFKTMNMLSNTHTLSHNKIAPHSVRGGLVTDGLIEIAWSTFEEQNVASYSIQRASGEVIGELVPTVSNSSYSFTDSGASKGENIYSLVVIFNDGETYCFATVTVN